METPFDLKTVDALLSTTRAVRRRLDLERPVEEAVLRDCIRLSQQAPTGSNQQTWRWMIVTDAEKRARLGEIYGRGRDAIGQARERLAEGDPQTARVYDSAEWLLDHLGEVPVHVIPCVVGRPPERFHPAIASAIYGSIFPAVWSFQLALRSRGLGSAITTLHLIAEQEVADLLGIPDDVLQVALLPVAHTRGLDFKPAKRPPESEITYWDSWGARRT